MKTSHLALLLLAPLTLGLAVASPRSSATGVERFEPLGFRFQLDVEVPLAPEAAFDAFTGDVSPWWDHRMSEEPTRFEIEPAAGGAFVEIFDESGAGLHHAQVTWAQRGKRLVFRGPLGFHGRAVDMVHSFDFEATEAGTRLTARVHGLGEFEESEPAVVEAVWEHFLGSYAEHARGLAER